MADETAGGVRSIRAPKQPPKTLEVTCIERIVGEETDDETGQKIVLEPGQDAKLSRMLAIRLASGANPRVAIGKDDRTRAKKVAKANAALLKKRHAAAAAAVDPFSADAAAELVRREARLAAREADLDTREDELTSAAGSGSG